MMKFLHVRNERGVVMMMVLLIATITLAVTTTMLYMLLQSTRFSGFQKRLATSAEAAMAGTDVIREIITRGSPETGMNVPLKTALAGSINFSTLITNSCFLDKLDKHTYNWGTACDKDLDMVTLGADADYDFMFTLGDYNVYTKIVYTIRGNTAAGGSTDRFSNLCVVHCGTGSGFAGLAIPATYAIEVDAQHHVRPNDSTKLSILYQR